jgi:DNA-binding HxlR family transcriptional regulator
MSVIHEKRPGCIQSALSIIGDQWTGLLVRELTECPKTFSELQNALTGISPRTLSQRLDKLSHEQIIEKDLYCPRPPRYKYRLTQKGSELKEVIQKMSEWGERYSTTH